MATITKIKNKSGIRWKALIRRGVRSKSKTFRLKSSAVAWAEQMERGDELAIALNCPGAAMRFEELAEAYMRDYSGKDHTRANRVKFWVERIGKTRLTDISATMIKKHLEDYLSGCALSYGGVGPDLKTRTRKLDRKRSPASRNRMKAGLAAVLAYAREREYLPAGSTVTSTVPILKENNKRQRYLSDEERERLLKACRASGDDLRLMSVATTDELVDEGQSLVIVAIVDTALHIRIFDMSGEKVVDKAESELIPGKALSKLKQRLDPFPDESALSLDDKQEIKMYATSSAGHPQESNYDRLYLLVLMGITTGARLGEILPRKWSEIDFERKHIHLETSKNEEPRIIVLTDPVLKEMKKYRGIGDALVFPGKQRTHRPFRGWRTHWHRALKQAGVEGFHFHDLRHSCASFLLKCGYTLDQIGQVLGHKSVQTTRRYAHLDIGTKEDMIQDVFGKVGENGDDD